MIKSCRAVLIVTGFLLFGIGAFFISFIIFPIINCFSANKNKDYLSVVRSSWSFLINYLEKVKIIKLNIQDKEKLQSINNKVVVATHPSLIDIIILMVLIPNSVCFAKKELMDNILLKNILSSCCITSDLDLDGIKTETKKFLDNGYNVIIFPSGIRHQKNEFPRIKKGATVVAMNANKDIMPIQMFNDCKFLQIGQPIYDAGDRVINYYIKPLEIINIEDYKNLDDVDKRKYITKDISNSLYNYIE